MQRLFLIFALCFAQAAFADGFFGGGGGGGGSGTVTSVLGTSPIASDGSTTTPTISLGTVPATKGGTGVANNAANTITFTGNYSLGLTLIGNTALTSPTSGTILTDATAPVFGTLSQGGLVWNDSATPPGHFTITPITGPVCGNGTSAPTACSGGTGTTTIASGAKALATTTITSATCTAAQDGGTATGVLTTDAITASFNGDPTPVTGFVPLTSGMLTIIAYPTADHVNFKECNNTAGDITPGAITINWRVTR